MLTRRTILLGGACVAIATPARTADSSALAFVTAIYDAYKGKNAKGHPLDDARAIRRYFAPSLAALISKDQKEAARRHEVGKLDGDPFIDAQDWDIAAFDIAMNDAASGKTTATVKFVNDGNAKTVMLDLVKIKNDWRISDITWMREGKSQTLRGLFAH